MVEKDTQMHKYVYKYVYIYIYAHVRRGGPSDPPIDPAFYAPSERILFVKLLGPPRHTDIDLHVHVPVCLLTSNSLDSNFTHEYVCMSIVLLALLDAIVV